MYRSARRARSASLAALLAAFLLATIALASGPTSPAAPPETAVISPGGVDMASGQYRDATAELSIGSDEAGGITFERVKQAGYAFVSNWRIVLQYSARKQLVNGASTSVGERYSITSRAISKTFNAEGGVTPYEVSYSEVGPNRLYKPSGSSYWAYASADGTVIQFGYMGGDGRAFANSITHANGVTYSFSYDQSGPSYDQTRLRRVTSNAGFVLLIDYASGTQNITKACVLNAAVTTPSATSCPSSARSVSYGYSGDTLASITDPLGNVSTIATSSPSPGVTQQAYYKPGLSGAYLTNTLQGRDGFQGTVVTQQAFAGGRTFSYGYELEPDASDGAIIIGDGRGTGWTENGTRTTALTWEVRQETDHADPGPLYISPSPVQIDDPLGRTTHVGFTGGPYGAFERVSSRTLASGRAETYAYDVGGMSERRWHAAGDAVPSLATTFTYDCTVMLNCAKPASVTTPQGGTTNYSYDPAHGGVLTETLPAASSGAPRPQKRYTYGQFYAYYRNDAGTLVAAPSPIWLVTQVSECVTLAASSCVGTADETRTTFSYGSSGTPNNLFLLSRTVAAGDGSVSATTSWTYDADGNRIGEDGPLAGSSDSKVWRYDAMRRVVGTVGSDRDPANPHPPIAVRNSYDAAGRLTAVEQGNVASRSDADWAGFAAASRVDYEYDLLDRKTKETRSSEGTAYTLTQYGYDTYGQPKCTAVRMNPAAYGSLPDACLQSTSAGGVYDRISQIGYDAGGRATTVSDGVGTGVQRVTTTTGYTADDLTGSVADANGNLTTYEYDGQDRLVKTRYPNKVGGGSSTSDYEELRYGTSGVELGLLTMRVLRDGQGVGYAHDARGQVTQMTPPAITWEDVTIGYQYDLEGHVLNAVDTGYGHSVGTIHDALGRLVQENGPYSTKLLHYDAGGRLTSLEYGDGVSIHYVYDAADELTSILENGTTPLFTFGYDDQGRRTGLTRANGTTTRYGYDGIGRLQTLTNDLTGTGSDLTIGLTYNPAGQIATRTSSNDAYAWTQHYNVSRGYTANGLNQYVASGAVTPVYDARGNLTSAGGVGYGYTALNRIEWQGSPGNWYYHDASGRLDVDVVVSLLFDHQGSHMLRELSGSGATLRRYVWGPGEDEPLLWYEGSGLGDKRWLYADERGSVVAVGDGGGNARALNAYDEYGIPQSTNMGRFQYTGQAWMPTLGMYNYKARIYSPTLGRFLQTDPIGYKDGPNWYEYVKDDPVNHGDPTGTETGSFANSGLSGIDQEPITWDKVGVAIISMAATIAPALLPEAALPAEAAAGARALTKAEQIATNAAQGARGEAATAAKLGDRVAGKQVTFKTSEGTRTRADFVTKDRGVVETKTGNAGLTKGQEQLHSDIKAGREITPVGQNAKDAGLRPGEPTRMGSCSVDRPCQ